MVLKKKWSRIECFQEKCQDKFPFQGNFFSVFGVGGWWKEQDIWKKRGN